MIGETIGPYRIERELGTGGMGAVYLAEVTSRTPGIETGTKVALKLVHPHLLETPGFFKRFLREAEIGKAVDTDTVVRTLDVDAAMKDGKQINFLVMEYVEGQTLRALQEELGRVPEELCRTIGREICKALAAIHAAGIVHRDLKPDNALITSDERVKVMDLGVARLADEVIRLSQTGAFVGSVLYAAPEQFKGAGDIDGRADLYALGLTLYELTTARHPFADEDLRVAMRKQLQEDPRPAAQINPQISPFLEEVLTTLLAKDRDQRFATAEDLLAVLEEGESSAWWLARAKAIRTQTKQPLRRVRIPRETDLHGRDAEIGKLRAAYEKAKDGHGQVLLIEGEAGIGKTRLVDEFVGLLRQEGEDLNFLFGSYPPGGAATASGAFSTAYREQFGAEGLEDTLRKYVTETPVLIPAFAALLCGDSTPKGEEPLTKDSIHTVFVHITRALAAERPTIVLIDDLGFAPSEGRAMFSALSLAIQDHRVLLVATSRLGLPEDWVANLERNEHGSRTTLHRLGPKDLSGLLVDAFRSERLAQELAYEVGAKSDGNPFFVFEIIRGLREGQYITKSEDGSWVQTQVIRDIKIPSSVLDLIQARIADLDEAEKDLLEVASCLGYEFDPSLVAEAAGIGVLPALKQFARIEKQHRLIRSAGRKYIFDHHQVQESLYEGLFEQMREHYHAALGDAIEARGGAADVEPEDVDGGIALALCNHFLSARVGEKALRYLDRALKHLGEGYLHEDAVILADRALSTDRLLAGPDRLGMLFTKASGLGSLGRRDEERATLDEAMSLALASGNERETARAKGHMGNHLYEISDLEAALEMHESAIALAKSVGDARTEHQSLGQLGLILWSMGRFEDSRAHYERSIEAVRAVGDVVSESTMSGNIALSLWDLGRTADARRNFERQIEIAGERQNAIATLNLGELLGILGQPERARELLERARDRSRETGNRRLLAAALHELGDVLERSGDLALAQATYKESIELNRAVRYRYDEAETLVLLGRLLLNSGKPEEAREHLEQALAVSTEIDRSDSQALAAAYLALLPDGDPTRAEALCAANEKQIGLFENVELRYVLWWATNKFEHLTEAHGRLMFLRDHAPEDCKTSIIENVPLHAEIVKRWNEHRDVDAW